MWRWGHVLGGVGVRGVCCFAPMVVSSLIPLHTELTQGTVVPGDCQVFLPDRLVCRGSAALPFVYHCVCSTPHSLFNSEHLTLIYPTHIFQYTFGHTHIYHRVMQMCPFTMSTGQSLVFLPALRQARRMPFVWMKQKARVFAAPWATCPPARIDCCSVRAQRGGVGPCVAGVTVVPL